ncbi:MAG: hypothetical protein AAF512_14735 [Pseudomonadota bacterium]
MKLYDPTTGPAEHKNARAPQLASLNGLTIGLLSNSKVNADVLLKETAAIFAEKHGCKVIDLKFKRNASAPAPKETIEELSAECDFLLTASGD